MTPLPKHLEEMRDELSERYVFSERPSHPDFKILKQCYEKGFNQAAFIMLKDMEEMAKALEKIKLLEEVCGELMGSLKLIADDLDMIGVTPTELSHLAIVSQALESARQKLEEK